ncbi:MAG: ATP-dependent DNA helicase RecG [Candidatus Latescibacteria bacterium]|nr:ATP-dependent DNA helicase RecG [bacterium]MBD3424222.1 ATP-dependent DNA helicase RecG [Candidatus Latescibacterota bacterium]
MNKKQNNDILRTSSQYVRGVGPARQKLLLNLGIRTVEDLIMHFPRKYQDRSNMKKISELEPGDDVTFSGVVLAVSLRKLGRRRSLLTVAVGDETGRVNLVFFNQPYLEDRFKQGKNIIASGRVNLYRGDKQVSAPDFEFTGRGGDKRLIHTGRIVPVYPSTSGISQRMMRRIIRTALDRCSGSILENLPAQVIGELGLMTREESFRQIHYPEGYEVLETARRRFKFEELFFIHILLRERRKRMAQKSSRPDVSPPYPLLRKLLGQLPFSLTESQKKVMSEIRSDMESGRGLSRLVQGDVGSGKTVVSLLSMFMAIDCGYQTAMMVPTELLALQHFTRIRDYLSGLPVRVELLVGSLKAMEKKEIHKGLASGEIDMVIGTQALIQEAISFRRLGFAVIDEQHRFGVKQRARLGSRGELPHFLVMTATPIPRSLAQIVYGDLELSVIEKLPFGRRKVTTEVITEDDRGECYSLARKVFRKGEQAFILYPLIEETESSDLKAAVNEFETLQKEVFPRFPLGLLHGRMSYQEKSMAIESFKKGDISALVTTTVIEVGVDIPNASLLIINNAERFGLAQLHQLRGRIGRKGKEGVCYLIPGEDAGGDSLRRLNYFASTTDGFRVAEKDLQLRGPGEIWGVRQSGRPVFRLLNPVSDTEIVKYSWKKSEELVRDDPGLKKKQNRVVAEYFRDYYKPGMEIADIG